VNERGERAEQSGPCGACHAVHHLARRPEPAYADPGGDCATCHSATAKTPARVPGRVIHPLTIPDHGVRSELRAAALPSESDWKHPQSGEMDCSTCHDPHSGSASLLRLAGQAEPQELCFSCHAEVSAIDLSFHNRESLQGVPMAGQTCGPCHSVHASASSPTAGLDTGAPLMWKWPHGQPAVYSETTYCTSCHSQAAGLHDIAYRKHLPIAMTTVSSPDSPAFMPLVDPQGRGGLVGSISCITCHLPHGRTSSDGFDAERTFSQPEPVAHATKPMLRPYVAPNLCSSCHGFEGLSLFLTFHERARPPSQR
jgi:predicted CXXCH cytochrome family protein